jgi:hypothetical protein
VGERGPKTERASGESERSGFGAWCDLKRASVCWDAQRDSQPIAAPPNPADHRGDDGADDTTLSIGAPAIRAPVVPSTSSPQVKRRGRCAPRPKPPRAVFGFGPPLRSLAEPRPEGWLRPAEDIRLGGRAGAVSQAIVCFKRGSRGVRREERLVAANHASQPSTDHQPAGPPGEPRGRDLAMPAAGGAPARAPTRHHQESADAPAERHGGAGSR